MCIVVILTTEKLHGHGMFITTRDSKSSFHGVLRGSMEGPMTDSATPKTTFRIHELAVREDLTMGHTRFLRSKSGVNKRDSRKFSLDMVRMLTERIG